LAQKMGYKRNDVYLVENGQEIIFTKEKVRFGQKVEVKNVYVDEVSGEEVENFVVRDRERLAKEGIFLVLAEIKTSDGQLASKPEIISRGSSITDTREISASLMPELERTLTSHKERVTNWVYLRRLIGKTTEQHIYRKFRMHPLVLPIVIEV